MWFIQPKKDYLSEMPWERCDETEVMSWQIRVRDYNVKAANFVFLGIVLFSASFCSFYAYLSFENDPALSLGCAGLFLFVTPFFMGMTHQTSIVAYRLTDHGYEVFSWKPQIDSVKPIMKWTAIVSGIVLLFLMFVNPYFVYGMVGPAGFGLMALLMGNSDGYQSLVRGEEHFSAPWENVEEVVLWRKRCLIGLRFTFYTSEGVKQTGYRTLYCKRGEEDERVAFIKRKVKDAPYVEKEMEVYEGGMAV